MNTGDAMTIEDANTLIPTLAALRGEILDLRNLLADMESDCVYWRKRCEEAEQERDQAIEDANFKSYSRRLP